MNEEQEHKTHDALPRAERTVRERAGEGAAAGSDGCQQNGDAGQDARRGADEMLRHTLCVFQKEQGKADEQPGKDEVPEDAAELLVEEPFLHGAELIFSRQTGMALSGCAGALQFRSAGFALAAKPGTGEGGEQPMIAEQGPSCNTEETFSHLVAES